jgi:hypothetical protein
MVMKINRNDLREVKREERPRLNDACITLMFTNGHYGFVERWVELSTGKTNFCWLISHDNVVDDVELIN